MNDNLFLYLRKAVPRAKENLERSSAIHQKTHLLAHDFYKFIFDFIILHFVYLTMYTLHTVEVAVLQQTCQFSWLPQFVVFSPGLVVRPPNLTVLKCPRISKQNID